MSEPTIKIYESDGSDGYSEGTWGCTVTVGRFSSGDGGFASKDSASKRAEKLAYSLRENNPDSDEDTSYGYTFEAWLRAAGRSDSASQYDLRAAWRAGEKPSDYTV